MAKYLTTVGYCSTTKKPFGIQLRDDHGAYVAVGSFATLASGESGDEPEYSGKLVAADTFKCKHCQNDDIIQCVYCGAIVCMKRGVASVTCPKCGRTFNVRYVDFKDLPDSNVKSKKQ